jgi:hypothetical protein
MACQYTLYGRPPASHIIAYIDASLPVHTTSFMEANLSVHIIAYIDVFLPVHITAYLDACLSLHESLHGFLTACQITSFTDAYMSIHITVYIDASVHIFFLYGCLLSCPLWVYLEFSYVKCHIIPAKHPRNQHYGQAIKRG